MSITRVITDTPLTEYVVNMPRGMYRHRPGLNPSSLAAGLMDGGEVDPRAIRDAYEGVDKTRSAAAQDRMDRGTLAHLALLQPERLASDVAVWSGDTRRGAVWDAFQAENVGKLIIRSDDYASVMETVNAMRSQPIVSALLCDIVPEVAMFTRIESHGLTLQGRGQVDAVNFADKVIVDIKTTEAGIDQRSCERTIRDMHYREKMAFYRNALAGLTGTDPEQWRCWNLFLSLGDRVGIRAMKFATDAMEFGTYRMNAAIDATASCLATGKWPMFAKSDIMSVAPWEMPDESEVDIDYRS